MEGLNNKNENYESRKKIHDLIKESLIASRSTAYNAKEREEKAEKEIEEFLDKNPEYIDKIEEIQDSIAKSL
jgi:hypothetical protein